MLKQTLFAAVGLAAASLANVAAHAGAFSFTGSFTKDDDVQLFSFSVGAPSPVTFRSWSYAGGINAAGALIPRGGFDIMIAVYTAAGVLIDQNDDGTDLDPNAPVAVDLSGWAWDVLFTLNLAAGNYLGAVLEFPNFAAPPNLASGFTHQGEPEATNAYPCNTPQTMFHDQSQSAYCERTNQWAFDILNVDAAAIGGAVAVPEPASLALLGFGALTAFGLRRRSGA